MRAGNATDEFRVSIHWEGRVDRLSWGVAIYSAGGGQGMTGAVAIYSGHLVNGRSNLRPSGGVAEEVPCSIDRYEGFWYNNAPISQTSKYGRE